VIADESRSPQRPFEVIPNQNRVTPQTTIAGSLAFQSPRSAEAQNKREMAEKCAAGVVEIALLTGGGDKPYALGLATALTSEGITVEFIGSDDLDVAELQNNPQVRFLNLRGDQRPEVAPMVKAVRVVRYYLRLIRYAATARPRIFHILWNNKFQLFDCTLLMLYYKFLGKKIVLTAHNVNIRERDSKDTLINRFSLRVQYQLSDHIFVHTEKMKCELSSDFWVAEGKVSVVPFGINNTVPNTALTTLEAKQRLGVSSDDKTMLFFGNIAPYKGLEYLVAAFAELLKRDGNYRLVIAGRPKWSESYWNHLRQSILRNGLRDHVIERIEYVPDDQTELYFKAADVLILPYTRIFQSGVLFLGYAFGLPAIAADVATLKEEIIEGKTGFVFKSQDSSDLARMIGRYFESDLFRDLERRRLEIRQYANERYSWDKVAAITTSIYSNLLTSDL
jgi:glycosyltransferase involved in cell wall biosynthesis